jgi:hypothetical protein
VGYVAGKRISIDGDMKQVGDPIPDEWVRRCPLPQLNALLNQGHIRVDATGGAGAMAGPGLQAPAPQVPVAAPPPQLSAEQEAALAALDEDPEEPPEPGEEVDPLVSGASAPVAAPEKAQAAAPPSRPSPSKAAPAPAKPAPRAAPQPPVPDRKRRG